MTNIKRLNEASTIYGGDRVPLWSTRNSQSRYASINTVLEFLQDNFEGVNSFTAAGASGDGTTDDTTALQAVFDSVNSGDIVDTGRGNYTFLVTDITIPSGLIFVGNGTIKGAVSGTKPDETALTGAVDNSARSVLMSDYWSSTVTITGGDYFGGLVVFENLLFSSSVQINQGIFTLNNCGFDGGGVIVNGGAAVVRCSSLVITNHLGTGLYVFYDGYIYSSGTIITNGNRGCRVVVNGTIVNLNMICAALSGEACSVENAGAIRAYNMTVQDCTGTVIQVLADGFITANPVSFSGNTNATLVKATGTGRIDIDSPGTIGINESTYSPLYNTIGNGNALINSLDDIGDSNIRAFDAIVSGTLIAEGEVTSTISASNSIDASIGGIRHKIETFNGAASDSLKTIQNGVDGQIIIIRAASSSRTVSVVNNNGNIYCGVDRSLDNSSDTMMLQYNSDVAAWLMISHSDNA